MRRFAVPSAFLVLAASSAAQAQDLNLEFVTGLADRIAAEAYCGLSYDQAVLGQLPTDHIPADDLTFTDLLKNLTFMAELRQKQFGASAKTAHCTQITRLAAGFGLLD